MNFAFESSFLLLAKVGLLFFLLIYVVFAIVVVKQVKLMTKTLELGFETCIEYLSYLHLAFAVLTFLMAIFLL